VKQHSIVDQLDTLELDSESHELNKLNYEFRLQQLHKPCRLACFSLLTFAFLTGFAAGFDFGLAFGFAAATGFWVALDWPPVTVELDAADEALTEPLGFTVAEVAEV